MNLATTSQSLMSVAPAVAKSVHYGYKFLIQVEYVDLRHLHFEINAFLCCDV